MQLLTDATPIVVLTGILASAGITIGMGVWFLIVWARGLTAPDSNVPG